MPWQKLEDFLSLEYIWVHGAKESRMVNQTLKQGQYLSTEGLLESCDPTSSTTKITS